MFGQTKKFSLVFYICLGLTLSILFSFVGHNVADANSSISVAQTAVETDVATVNWWQAIALGFVQGATEFIPISSTGHLKVIPVFFGWGDPGVSFSAVIQLGSIAAVLSYFWSDLAHIVKGMVKAIRISDYDSQEFWMAIGIAVGSIPIIVFGLLLTIYEPPVYEETLRSMTSIAIVSIIMAILLALAESMGNQKRNFKDLTVRDGVLIGLAQAMALVPGTSRSGSTITAGLFSNLDRETAARYSFLLGIPSITAAGLVGLKDLISPVEGVGIGWLPLIAGLISSAVFSYLAIAWLLEFLKRRSTWVFVWYRLLFGVVILAAVALGWVN